MPTDFLTLSDIAEILDVKPASARVYHEVAQRNRREAAEYNRPQAIRPTDMPEPVRRIGRTPVWTQESIDEWMTRRTPRRRANEPSSETVSDVA